MERKKSVGILRMEVEEKIGRKLTSPTDFNELILRMQKDIGETLSLSTLKRIWEYADASHRTSDTSLSCLARFAGYKDWHGFLTSCGKTGETDSGFLTSHPIHTDMLQKDDTIELGWEPDRYCRVAYMGKGMFKVVESRNGKLKAGDTFRASTFSLGLPLCATDIQRGKKRLGTYIAGRKKGLSLLNRVG